MANRLWRYVYRRDKFWEDIGIPYVPSKPVVGTLDFFERTPQHDLDTERWKKYGRIFGQFEGKTPILMISDPDLLKKILLDDFPAFSRRRSFNTGNPVFDDMVSVSWGDKWRRVRDIVQPTFENQKLVKMVDIWYNSSSTLVKNFAKTAGRPVDGKKLYGTYTVDVIALAAFGKKIESHQDPNNIFIREAQNIFTRRRTWRLSMWLFLPFWAKTFRVNAFSQKGTNFFGDAANEEIMKRDKSKLEKNDFLQLLINAEKEYNQSNLASKAGGGEAECIRHKCLSHVELMAQCVLFFAAGFDTTSSTLAFASYFLALNPDIQDKVRADIDENIKAHGGKITYESVSNMKYLHMMFLETMRMLPAATRIERVAGRDYELGSTGIIVPKETVVAIPMLALHNDHELFPDPEKFRPERHTLAERKKRHSHAFLPFGHGPRHCLGQLFALMQMKFCMAFMLSRFVLKRCPETKVPLDLTSPQNILQPSDVTFVVENREGSPFNPSG